jgi:hypothetical protein
MKFLGYRYDFTGRSPQPVELINLESLAQFIKANYEAPQLIITDTHDRQLLLIRDGVDLFNELDPFGISLVTIFDELRQEATVASGAIDDRPQWEILYDRVGLSTGEIRMRQRVKAACRAAQTVGDVADLICGTYFDAHFLSSDRKRWYRHFNQENFSATVMKKDETGEWVEDPESVILSPTARVRHLRSSEDIHTFEFLE